MLGRTQPIGADRNRTIKISPSEKITLKKRLLRLSCQADVKEIQNRTINQDLFSAIDYLPERFVDLMFVDSPYNLNKDFNSRRFKEMPSEKYEEWLDSWLSKLRKILKPTASVYVCGDWKSSSAIFRVMSKYFAL